MDVGDRSKRNARKVAILLGTLAHRRLTNTFKDIGARYDGTVVSAKSVYPPRSDLGLPVVSRTSVRDVVRLIPKVGSRVPWGPDQYLFRLDRVLADADIVLAHGASALYSYQAARFCERSGRPLVVQEVSLIPLRDLDNRFYPHRARALSSAKLVVAVTDRARAALMLEGVPAEKLRLIPYGIDTRMFYPGARQPETRSRLGFSDDQTVVLFVGYVRWDKGVYDLVHAAGLLRDDPSLNKCNLQFAFVGGGPDSSALRERIRHLNLLDRCHLLGAIPYEDMPAVYAAADIVAVPSIPGKRLLEQWCLVLSEAMATGIPVIASRCGGMPEVVGEAGLLVHPADPLSLADAIKRLAADKHLRKELGAAGLARVLERFDSRVVGSLWADILDEV